MSRIGGRENFLMVGGVKTVCRLNPENYNSFNYIWKEKVRLFNMVVLGVGSF